MQVFTKQFLDLDSKAIVSELDQKGYFCFEGALTAEFMASVMGSVETHRFGLNKNWTHGVQMGRQYYFTHMLSISKEFFDYVCHPKVFQVSHKVLGDQFRLKAMRYYETQGGHHMQWHTDNKTDKDIADIPGIIFIAYLTDVQDGEFQYVAGSHEWSGRRAYSDYTDEEIESQYKDKVVSFKKPKGTILIYNTYGIHRAKPVKDPHYLRKSLFFQVDSEMENAEPILLDPAFCRNLTDDMKKYLGFGLPSNYEIYPNTELKNHPMTLEMGKRLIYWFAYRMVRFAFDIMPQSLKNKIKSRRKAYGV